MIFLLLNILDECHMLMVKMVIYLGMYIPLYESLSWPLLGVDFLVNVFLLYVHEDSVQLRYLDVLSSVNFFFFWRRTST